MPESPLVQKEAVALSDLEALIADRAKRESETELGFRKRIEREEAEYKAVARQLAAKYKVDSESLEAQYGRARDEVSQTFQRDTQACKNEYAQTKKQIDDQFKKDQRRAKKAKEETGWQALAFFEGSREEGVKWRRGADANWHAALDELHLKKETAEFVLNRCGRLAANLPEAVTPPASETPAAPARAAATDSAVPSASPDAADAAAGARRAGRHHSAGRPPQDQCTRIDEELIALEALRLPKFLRIDVFVWPFLLLAVGLIAGLGLGTGVGWTPAAIVGVVAGLAAGIGAYIGTGEDGSPQRGAPCRAIAEGDRRGRPTRRTEQGLGQERVRKQASRARQKP